MTCALKLAYKGTAYCGWQVQKNARSVQQTLQDAMETAFGSRGTVTGCSRTDAGVHAKGFVCKAEGLPEGIPVHRVPEALGRRLPPDIAVREAWRVPDDFHPRYDAKGKEYSYRIRNSRLSDPFDFEYAPLWFPTIDEKRADALCKRFCGTQDFRSFQAAGSDITDTVRTVSGFSCRREGDLVIFTVTANGFLYNMARILVGTVLDLLDDPSAEERATEILAARDRAAAGRTMPAKGLCLERVFY